MTGIVLAGGIGLLALALTYLSYRWRNLLLVLAATLSWFALTYWTFISDSALFDLATSEGKLLIGVFILLVFVPLVLQMNAEVRVEGKAGLYSKFVRRGQEEGPEASEYDKYKKELRSKTRNSTLRRRRY